MQPDPHQYEVAMRHHQRAQRQIRRGAGPMGRAAMDPARAVDNLLDNLFPIGPGPKADALRTLVNGRV